MKILVTGGCGFIGSNFIKYTLEKNIFVINLDLQTYAGQGKNIEHMQLDKHEKYKFVRGNICDKRLLDKIFSEEKPDIVFNFAAETHVDRSIKSSENFFMTNIIGAANLFDFAIKYKTSRFVQISTDEVYGSIEKGSFSEESKLNPRNPYAASKAAADILAISYFETHNLPLIITRSTNNYGPYQFPEKFLPLFITNLIEGKKVPLMFSNENPGLNVRDWLHVEDNCAAIWLVAEKGKEGEIYNISGENERKNIEMTKMLLEYFGYGEEMIQYVEHRKAHDFRYSINCDKLKALGFQHKHKNLESEVKNVIEWYKENIDWWKQLKKLKK